MTRRVPKVVPVGVPVTQKEWESLCTKSRVVLIDVIEKLVELRAEAAAAKLDGDVSRGEATSDSDSSDRPAKDRFRNEDG